MGSLALLDKVTERAKVQALADMGIGCAWPVVFENDLDTTEIVLVQDNTSAQVAGQVGTLEQPSEQSNGHKPARTAETVQAFWQKAYHIKPQEIETRWSRFVLGVTGRPLDKGPLSEDECSPTVPQVRSPPRLLVE
jgi:hypothetical protein